jgi:hypothetical protein
MFFFGASLSFGFFPLLDYMVVRQCRLRKENQKNTSISLRSIISKLSRRKRPKMDENFIFYILAFFLETPLDLDPPLVFGFSSFSPFFGILKSG